jgi:hypothetical protein
LAAALGLAAGAAWVVDPDWAHPIAVIRTKVRIANVLGMDAPWKLGLLRDAKQIASNVALYDS